MLRCTRKAKAKERRSRPKPEPRGVIRVTSKWMLTRCSRVVRNDLVTARRTLCAAVVAARPPVDDPGPPINRMSQVANWFHVPAPSPTYRRVRTRVGRTQIIVDLHMSRITNPLRATENCVKKSSKPGRIALALRQGARFGPESGSCCGSAVGCRMPHPRAAPRGCPRTVSRKGRSMADAAFALLIIVGFVVCALTLRALHSPGAR